MQEIKDTGRLKGVAEGFLEGAVPALMTGKLLGIGSKVAAGGGKAAVAKAVGTGMATEFGTEGAQDITGQMAENHLRDKQLDDIDYKQAFNAAMAGAVAGGGMGAIGGAGQVLHSKIGAGVDKAREVVADPVGTAANIIADGGAKLGTLAAKAQAAVSSKFENHFNEEASNLSKLMHSTDDATSQEAALAHAQRVLLREDSSEESKKDAAALVNKQMNWQHYKDKQFIRGEEAHRKLMDDDIANEILHRTGEGKQSRMSPTLTDDFGEQEGRAIAENVTDDYGNVVRGMTVNKNYKKEFNYDSVQRSAAILKAQDTKNFEATDKEIAEILKKADFPVHSERMAKEARELAKKQRDRDIIGLADIWRKQGVKNDLIESSEKLKTADRASAVATLGWVSNGFTDTEGNLFVPESFTRKYKDKSVARIAEATKLAVAQGLLDAEQAKGLIVTVSTMAKKQWADQTNVIDTVMSAVQNKPLGRQWSKRDVEGFIPELRRMAENGTTQREENFLEQLFGSKEGIAKAMSAFKEKNVAEEPESAVTQRATEADDLDYATKEKAKAPRLVGLLGAVEDNATPFDTSVPSQRLQAEGILGTTQLASHPGTIGLVDHYTQGLEDDAKREAQNTLLDEHGLDHLNQMQKNAIEAYGTTVSKYLEGASPNTRTAILGHINKRFRYVTENMQAEDAQAADKVYHAESFAEDFDPRGEHSTVHKGSLFLETTGKTPFKTSAMKVLKHVWRANSKEQVTTGAGQGAHNLYQQLMQGLAALTTSDEKFTGRIGFKTSAGQAKPTWIDGKGQLPKEFRLSKATVDDALKEMEAARREGDEKFDSEDPKRIIIKYAETLVEKREVFASVKAAVEARIASAQDRARAKFNAKYKSWKNAKGQEVLQSRLDDARDRVLASMAKEFGLFVTKPNEAHNPSDPKSLPTYEKPLNILKIIDKATDSEKGTNYLYRRMRNADGSVGSLEGFKDGSDPGLVSGKSTNTARVRTGQVETNGGLKALVKDNPTRFVKADGGQETSTSGRKKQFVKDEEFDFSVIDANDDRDLEIAGYSSIRDSDPKSEIHRDARGVQQGFADDAAFGAVEGHAKRDAASDDKVSQADTKRDPRAKEKALEEAKQWFVDILAKKGVPAFNATLKKFSKAQLANLRAAVKAVSSPQNMKGFESEFGLDAGTGDKILGLVRKVADELGVQYVRNDEGRTASERGQGDALGRPEGARGMPAPDKSGATPAAKLGAGKTESAAKPVLGKLDAENDEITINGKVVENGEYAAFEAMRDWVSDTKDPVQASARVEEAVKALEKAGVDESLSEMLDDVLLEMTNVPAEDVVIIPHNKRLEAEWREAYDRDDIGTAERIDILEEVAEINAEYAERQGRLLNSQTTNTKQAAKEEVAAARKGLLDVLGDTVQLAFKRDLGGVSGDWREGHTINAIRIALNSDVLGTMYHETLHEFFNVLGKHGDTKVRELLQKVATNSLVMHQLERLLAKHQAALDQLHSDPEEAVAFMYQFWRAGALKLGPQATTFFGKVKQFFADLKDKITGHVRDEQHAELLMAAFARGSLKDASQRTAVVKALNDLTELHNKALESAGSFAKNFTGALKLVYTAEGMMELTKNKHVIKLAQMMNQKAGAAMVKGGEGDLTWEGSFFDAKSRVNAKYQNKLENILEGLEPADVELVREALATGTVPKIERIEKAVAAMTALNEELMDYIDARNISRLEDDGKGGQVWKKMQRRKDFGMPQVWDVDVIAKDVDSFKADLLKHHMKELEAIAKQANAEIAAFKKNGDLSKLGPAAKASVDKELEEFEGSGKIMGKALGQATITPEMVADAITTRVLMSNGKVDIEESTSELGITPLAASVNRRALDWINPKAFDKYKQKDLLNIYSSYIAGMTKRGEFTVRFGHGGEVIRDQADKAFLQEMGGDDLVRQAEVLHPRAVKVWAKARDEARDEAQKAGTLFDEPYPTLRMVGNDLHKTKVGQEQFDADMQQAAQALDQAFKALQAMEGTLGMDVSPAVRDLNSWLMTYQNVRLLPFSLFTSLSDVVGLTLNGGTLKDAWDAFVRGMREVKMGVIDDSKSMDDAAQRAEMWGAVDAVSLNETMGQGYGSVFMSGAARNLSNKFFKKIGMESWNRAMRVSAAAVAERMISGWASGKIDLNDASEKARLERLFGEGADPKAIKRDKDGRLDVNDPANQAAVMRFVNDAVLRPNAAMRPIWGSNPNYASFFHLKSFTYAMHKTWLEAALNEASLGNYRPAMVLLSVYLPVGIAAGAAKEMLIPGEEPPWMQGGLDGYLGYGASKAGLLGVPQMIGGAWDSGFTDLAGPSVSQVRKALFDYDNPLKTVAAALPAGGTLQRYVGD